MFRQKVISWYREVAASYLWRTIWVGLGLYAVALRSLRRRLHLLLVSEEQYRQDHFLELSESIFQDNATFNTNEDSEASSMLTGQENCSSLWWSAADAGGSTPKNLSTAQTQVEAKVRTGRRSTSLPSLYCSNNELYLIIIDPGEPLLVRKIVHLKVMIPTASSENRYQPFFIICIEHFHLQRRAHVVQTYHQNRSAWPHHQCNRNHTELLW